MQLVQRDTPFNRETRKLRAWSEPMKKSYLEQQLGQQAVDSREDIQRPRKYAGRRLEKAIGRSNAP